MFQLNMKFQSLHDSSYVEIERWDNDGIPFFAVSVRIADFVGHNGCVLFNNCQEFLRQLRVLDATRSGKVTLTGTEEFQLSIKALDGVGHLGVEVQVGDGHCWGTTVVLKGGFGFDTSLANDLFHQLYEMLRGCA